MEALETKSIEDVGIVGRWPARGSTRRFSVCHNPSYTDTNFAIHSEHHQHASTPLPPVIDGPRPSARMEEQVPRARCKECPKADSEFNDFWAPSAVMFERSSPGAADNMTIA